MGYAETLLAERAALLLWRLGRVARYEREATAIALENAEVRKTAQTCEKPSNPSREAQTVVTAHGRDMRTLPPDTEL